jgi:hypothetical protein
MDYRRQEEGRGDAPVERLLVQVRREAEEGADAMCSTQSIVQFNQRKSRARAGKGGERKGGKRHTRHAGEGEARLTLVEAVETLEDGQDRPVGHR